VYNDTGRDGTGEDGKENAFFAPILSKTIELTRQARDNHRKKLRKQGVFCMRRELHQALHHAHVKGPPSHRHENVFFRAISY
jgi:hypothetical protein